MDAPQTLNEWVNYLRDCPLPLLENTCQNIKALEPYENASMIQFSNIVLTDPGLSATILRKACAIPKKHLQGEVGTIDSATMILGLNEVKKTIEEMQFLDRFIDSPHKQLYMQIVSRAYHGAYQAFSMAHARNDFAPEEIFTAAILQDIGTLLLLANKPEALASFTTIDELDDETLQEKVFGFRLRQLSGKLVQNWQFSELIQHSFSAEQEYLNTPRIYEIHLARQLAKTAEQGWESPAMTELIETTAHHLHIPVSEALLEIRDNAIQSAEETPFYGVTPAAALLPPMEGKQPAKYQTTPKPEKIAEAHTQQDQSPEPDTIADTLDQLTPNDEIFNAVAHELEVLLSNDFNLAQFMPLLKRGFNQGLGLNQAFFSMITTDRKSLVSRFVFSEDHRFHNLRIPVDHNNLFQRLIDKPQALWVNDDNRKKVIPLLPKEFYKLIDVDEFFIMTTHIKGKAIGITFAARHNGQQALDNPTFEKFRQFCQFLAKGFESLSR